MMTVYARFQLVTRNNLGGTRSHISRRTFKALAH